MEATLVKDKLLAKLQERLQAGALDQSLYQRFKLAVENREFLAIQIAEFYGLALDT